MKLQKKIQRQKQQGNVKKVASLQNVRATRLQGHARSGGVKLKSGLTAPSAPTAPGQPTTGSTSQQAAAPAAPAAPAAEPTNAATPDASANTASFLNISSYNPASGQPDPRDSTYWADLAALQFQAQQDYSGEQLNQSRSDIDFTRQGGIDAENQRQNIRNTAESLIGTGLLRSGSHNRKQTEGVLDYTNLVTQRQTDKSRSDEDRRNRMNAIVSKLGIDELGLYSDASGRYSDAQAAAAADQEPALPDNVPEPPAAAAKKKKKKKKK